MTNSAHVTAGMSATLADYKPKSVSFSSVGMLDSLYKGNDEKEFRGIRVHPENTDGGSKTVDHTHGHLRYGTFTFSDTDKQAARRSDVITKISSARSSLASTRQKVQFYTLDSGDILAVSLLVKPIVKPGGRG